MKDLAGCDDLYHREPNVQAEEAKQPEKVEFMWDDYHRQQLEEMSEDEAEDWDDDWDEEDDEGVEFIYKR
ncbi:hypothetical protein ACNKHK_20625 [Shigella flexneri]